MSYTGALTPLTIWSDPIAGAPVVVPAPVVARATGDLSEFGGAWRLFGTVVQAGSPDVNVWRRVRLFDLRSGALVRETWSDPITGAYAFEGLASRDYVVESYDHTGTHQGVISVKPTLDPMP